MNYFAILVFGVIQFVLITLFFEYDLVWWIAFAPAILVVAFIAFWYIAVWWTQEGWLIDWFKIFRRK